MINSESFGEGNYILISEERVIMVAKQTDVTDNIGIVIEHPHIAKAMKAAFDSLWY